MTAIYFGFDYRCLHYFLYIAFSAISLDCICCYVRKQSLKIGVKWFALWLPVTGWNGFGDAGAEALADMIRANSTLVSLNLTNNRIKVKGSMALAQACRDNSTLEVIILAMNPLTDAGNAEKPGEQGNGDMGIEEWFDTIRVAKILRTVDFWHVPYSNTLFNNVHSLLDESKELVAARKELEAATEVFNKVAKKQGNVRRLLAA